MLKRIAMFCSLVFIGLLTLSCSSAPPPKAAKTKFTVAIIPNSASDYWKVLLKGCEKADAELADVEVNFQTPYGGTPKEQERINNELIRKDTGDAIAISPIDPASQLPLLNSMAKRVPLITLDSDAPDSQRLFYVGADNVAAGRQAGELLKQALPKGGKVMAFVGKKEVLNAQERFAGLKEAVQGTKIEVLDLMTDGNDHIKAKENAETAMQQYPDLAALVGLWSYNGPALVRAVENAKKTGKVKIVCFDEEKATLDGIQNGVVFGSVAQQPYEYGYQAVQLLAKLAKGDQSVIPASKKVYIPPVVLQRQNLADFRAKLSQWLGEK
jgi:ribose transport system substrate-binding protein